MRATLGRHRHALWVSNILEVRCATDEKHMVVMRLVPVSDQSMWGATRASESGICVEMDGSRFSSDLGDLSPAPGSIPIEGRDSRPQRCPLSRPDDHILLIGLRLLERHGAVERIRHGYRSVVGVFG